MPVGRGDVQKMRLTQNKQPKTKAKATELNIITYNVRPLSEDYHLEYLVNEISNIKWDVIGISEMRRPGENATQLPNQHILFHKGNDKKQRGVGFLIHKKLKGNITEFHATSDRVASVKIKISKRYDIKIIQAHAPTSLSSQDALDEFYDDLRTALQRKKAHFNIIKGDFNANERGDDLVNFATTNNFKITNTFYKKKQNRRWTWRSPDFETFNEIDYVLVDKSNIVKNTEVLNRVGIDSDHRMVRCKIQIDTKLERQKLFHSKQEPLRISKQIEKDFQIDLKNRFAVLEELEEENNNEAYVKKTAPLQQIVNGLCPEHKSSTKSCTHQHAQSHHHHHQQNKNQPPKNLRYNRGFTNSLISKTGRSKLAVEQSKKGKAPGPDNITIDLIEAAGDVVYDKLATLFNECLRQSTIPDEWNEAIIVLLQKKGDQTNISNYRPISLLNNIYKLFTKIITNRIAKTLDENQPREQAGFRKGFSTIDHLHSVNQLIEKCAEYRIPLVIGLVDYNKAFDSVEIPDVIDALEKQGVDPVYINILKHIYKNAKSFIRLHKGSKPTWAEE
ncbi:craniofacial development protein 2-like [Penaeus monodon]|uniref:craniofacial development protein 2-like n=1 Tax=Penaeus monodon TaxID=6687 RepID=UPI0018A7CCC0|nr:craniofacial development protein 2-like [Penaeus monodon]